MPLHKFITIAALGTGAAQLVFIFNLIYSRYKGAPAPENPWNGTTLEWSILPLHPGIILAASIRHLSRPLSI